MLLIDKDYKTYTVKEESEHALKETLKKLQCEDCVPAVVLSNKEVKEYSKQVSGKSVKTGCQLACRVGYLDKETLEFTEMSLVFGHIIVESIQVDMFYSQPRNVYEYKIYTRSVDEDLCYTFSTTGEVNKFFLRALPYINGQIEEGVKFSDMNLIMFNERIKECSGPVSLPIFPGVNVFLDKFIEEEFDHVDYLSKMILTCGMKRNVINSLYNNVDIEVRFESGIPYNPYVEWLLSLKLKNLKYNKIDDKFIYIGHYPIDRLGWISEELDLGNGGIYDGIRSYVVSDILFCVLSNFNQEHFVHGLKRINRTGLGV